MMASDTMATVTHNHPICQFRRAKVDANIIAYASYAAIARRRFGYYTIIVAISDIKSAIFNSVYTTTAILRTTRFKWEILLAHDGCLLCIRRVRLLESTNIIIILIVNHIKCK